MRHSGHRVRRGIPALHEGDRPSHWRELRQRSHSSYSDRCSRISACFLRMLWRFSGELLHAHDGITSSVLLTHVVYVCP